MPFRTLLVAATLAAFARADCSTSTSTCTSTICADYINSCGRWYGGCYAACSGYTTPSFTDPGCPSTTPPPSPTTTCTSTLCKDYVNSCGQMYGGCFPACSGYTEPSFTDPGCPSTTQLPTITSVTSCDFLCKDYFDSCGNTFGPGCFTSCPGQADPTYSTPYCAADATATASYL